MAGKIFYRERNKVGKKEKKPRFRLVGTSGVDLHLYVDHMRKKELEQIAGEVGAELILLKIDPKDGEEVEVS